MRGQPRLVSVSLSAAAFKRAIIIIFGGSFSTFEASLKCTGCSKWQISPAGCMAGTSHRLLPWQRIEWLNDAGVSYISADRYYCCCWWWRSSWKVEAWADKRWQKNKKKPPNSWVLWSSQKMELVWGAPYPTIFSLRTVVLPSPLHRQGCRLFVLIWKQNVFPPTQSASR